MTPHRSGWFKGIVGNPSRPSKVHYFDNDEGVSICGSMTWRKPMVAYQPPEDVLFLCKLCWRMAKVRHD